MFGVIKKLHDNRPQFTADYLECILLLFYCGVPKSQDIAQITEQTIDFEKKQILVDGRRVQLSDRCFELLQLVHKTTSTVNDRGTFSVVQWHDSYFRFIIRVQTEDTFQDMTLSQVGSLINRRISYDINYSLGEDITSRNVYYLGFYDHLVEKYGKEKIRDVVITGKNSENTALLLAEAEECGVYVDNPTHLKNSLQQFV